MTKYKLIKEYPGSPELGTEVEKDTKYNSSHSYFYRSGDKRICVFNDHVENNLEYWKEINDNIWWCVWYKDYIQEGVSFFKAWTPYKIECIPSVCSTNKHYLKTKEEAEQFILRNKPCLSLNDVSLILGGLDRKRDIFLELKRIVKSKL